MISRSQSLLKHPDDVYCQFCDSAEIVNRGEEDEDGYCEIACYECGGRWSEEIVEDEDEEIEFDDDEIEMIETFTEEDAMKCANDYKTQELIKIAIEKLMKSINDGKNN